KESGITKCTECYTSLPIHEKENYFGVLRHYVHLGLPERFETCHACSLILVTLRALVVCPECPGVLERFLIYLRGTGEQPWTDSESIIITISSARI
ncbi:hypothetical protein ALC60_09079, partial [Trachymyrmex zeteki]